MGFGRRRFGRGAREREDSEVKRVKTIPSGSPGELPMMDLSGIARKRLDVDYTPDNPHPARKLDIFYPDAGSGPFPTIVCIHGGAFVAGEKGDMQVAGFVDGIAYGFAVVSVEQRLRAPLPDGTFSPEGLFPNPLCDFKAAIRFLRKNAEAYTLDPERFAVAGDSAGAWHAVMAALTAGVPAFYDNALGHDGVDERVQAVVSWFGVGDLVVCAEYGKEHPMATMPDDVVVPRNNFEDIFLGVGASEHRNLAYLASPETWITERTPPVLLQHGTGDEVVPIENSRRIAERIAEVCGADRVAFDVMDGYLHGDERFYEDANLERVFSWLRGKLDPAC
jgi:acetyl esterase/lipase